MLLEIVRAMSGEGVDTALGMADAIRKCQALASVEVLELVPVDGSLRNWWYCWNGALYDPVQYRTDPVHGLLEMFKADPGRSIHGRGPSVGIAPGPVSAGGIVVVIHDEGMAA